MNLSKAKSAALIASVPPPEKATQEVDHTGGVSAPEAAKTDGRRMLQVAGDLWRDHQCHYRAKLS